LLEDAFAKVRSVGIHERRPSAIYELGPFRLRAEHNTSLAGKKRLLLEPSRIGKHPFGLVKRRYDLRTAHWESVHHALGGQTRRTVARMPRPFNLEAFRYTVKCSLDVAQARRMVNVGISVKRNE
jgi:hypothetical protein